MSAAVVFDASFSVYSYYECYVWCLQNQLQPEVAGVKEGLWSPDEHGWYAFALK